MSLDKTTVLEKYIRRTPEAAWRIFEGEALVIMPRESVLNNLNEVGTTIWELADGRLTVSEIVDSIVDQFDVDRARAEEDTVNFVGELLEQGMITIHDEPCPIE